MAQKILILINDAPYGTEKAFEADKIYHLPFEEEVISSIDEVFREKGRLAACEEIVEQFELRAQNSFIPS